MKVAVRLNERVTVHADADSPKEVFKQVALAQSTFEDTCCGRCKGKDILYSVRTVESNEFFEMKCQNPECRHVLTFGLSKEGGKIYPRRMETDKKGKAVKKDGKAVYLPHNGWLPPYTPTAEESE